MNNEIHNIMEEKMNKTVRVLKEELHSIRAGKANANLLDRIFIDYYGAQTPIKQIAAISVPEPRLLQIQPYDINALSDIEKAIAVSDLGINPANDGKLIRLVIPMLTEERRIDLTKTVKKKGEEGKIALRNERREANDKLKKQNKTKEITDDELKEFEETVQKITDKYIKIIDDLVSQKEKEMMVV